MKYKIDKGDHFSKLNIGKLQPFVYKWRGTFEINSNWWYEGDDIEYSGWNKLGGVSEFFTTVPPVTIYFKCTSPFENERL